MKLCCSVCGDTYEATERGTLEVCDGCWPNFAGNLLETPTARAALYAYFSSAHQMTPHQLEAMARMTEQWHRQAHAQED